MICYFLKIGCNESSFPKKKKKWDISVIYPFAKYGIGIKRIEHISLNQASRIEEGRIVSLQEKQLDIENLTTI